MKSSQVPFHALRSFEAVARHGSVKEAALELGVISSAVSHQVRKLEQRIGTRLFDRSGGALRLTEEGQRLLPGVAAGLEVIADAFAEHHRDRLVGPLRVSVLETFALYWLIPKMAAYPFRDDGRAIALLPTQRLVSFDTENVDAAIRLGDTSSQALTSEPLFTESLGLIAAPSLALPAPVFVSRHREAEWNSYTEQDAEAHELHVVPVESTSLAIKAAIDGVGLAFAPLEVIDHERSAGRVRMIGTASVSGRRSYHLVYPTLSRRDRRLRRFRDWLLDQIPSVSASDG